MLAKFTTMLAKFTTPLITNLEHLAKLADFSFFANYLATPPSIPAAIVDDVLRLTFWGLSGTQIC